MDKNALKRYVTAARNLYRVSLISVFRALARKHMEHPFQGQVYMVYHPLTHRWNFKEGSANYQSAILPDIPDQLDAPAVVFVIKASQIRPWDPKTKEWNKEWNKAWEYYRKFMNAMIPNLESWRRAIDDEIKRYIDTHGLSDWNAPDDQIG
jgi:hypothetical protein